MPVIVHTLGSDDPSEATGTTNCEIMKKYIDLAEPEHKMNSLTADIIYRYKTG